MKGPAREALHVFDTPGALARAAAEAIAARIGAVVAAHGRCRLALPGGNTPAACLRRLARHDLPWARIDWYMGDERCLPAGHAERNDSMIRQSLFAEHPTALACFHPVAAEQGAARAAQAYSATLAADIRQAGRPLDLVILGMGEDGHTASLFPGHAALDDPALAVAVFDAPKPPPERVSLGLNTLREATARIVLTAGQGKQAALQRVLAGEPLPVNRIGDAQWFIDKAALAV